MDQKQYLLGMTLAEITESVTELNLPKFTAKQIADWVYLKRVKSIDEMTNISLKNRETLSEKFDIGRSEPLDVKTSVDGTQKMLFKTASGKLIETFTIPEADTLTTGAVPYTLLKLPPKRVASIFASSGSITHNI